MGFLARTAAQLTSCLVAVLAIVGCSRGAPRALDQPVAAPVRMVTDTVHGTAIQDPYRWMEEPNNREFAEWMSAQGRYTQARLEATPGRAELLRRVRELSLSTSEVPRLERVGETLYFLRADAGASLAKLFVRDASGSERVLFDPTSSSSAQEPHASIENYSPSPEGGLVAIHVAEGGSEITRMILVETATGVRRPDVIERIWGQFSVSWLPDASGFFYTQMAKEGFENPAVDKTLGERVRFHRLDSNPEDDPVVLGPGVNPRMPIQPREIPWIDVPSGTGWALTYAGGARNEVRICVARLTELRGAKTPSTATSRWRSARSR